jgi:hypothetical protein
MAVIGWHVSLSVTHERWVCSAPAVSRVIQIILHAPEHRLDRDALSLPGL